MIPVLFDHFETDFTSNGLGRLDEAISCTVKEIINGEYELELQYPITGKLFQRMVTYSGVICATHDNNRDVQPFDIYKYSAPINGIVTFYAHHISYRLSNVICGDSVTSLAGNTPAYVFSMIPITAQNDVGLFTFSDLSGYTPTSVFAVYNGYVSVRDAFLNGHRVSDPVTGTEALYKVFPGEFEWKGWQVVFYRKRGSNKGVQIRYGKNMTEVTRERDANDLVSIVYPYWIGETNLPGGGRGQWIVFGNPAVSPYCEVNYAAWETETDQMETGNGDPYFFGSADLRAASVDFSQDFQTEPTQAQFRQAALDWMSKNSTWRAHNSITVKFADLYNVDGLEKLRLASSAKTWKS